MNAPSKFQITYDVYQPQKNFRKSDPGLPNHSVCVCRYAVYIVICYFILEEVVTTLFFH